MLFGFGRKDVAAGITPLKCPAAERFTARLKDPAPAVWMFAGDSITHGCYHTKGLRNYTEYLQWIIQNTQGRQSDFVINTAVSGATTRHAIMYNMDETERFKPDFLFIMYGMNDCVATAKISAEEFYLSNQQLIKRAKARGTQVILQTPQPSERDRHIAPYLEAVRSLALEHDCLLIDHHSLWKNLKIRRGYMSDGIHPNARGHLLYAETILKSLSMQEGSLPALKDTLPRRAPCDKSLTQALLADGRYKSLVLSDKPFLTVCATDEDSPLSVRDSVMHAQENIRYGLYNSGECSMMRFFIRVPVCDLNRAVEMFDPEVVVTYPSNDGFTINVRRM